MTKTVRFNLSGNTLFKNQPNRIIVENSGICLEDYSTDEEETNAENYRYEHPTTLKDVCVLLYEACGQGVMWQLSRELAERLHLDKKDIHVAVENIIHEYAEMTEEEAIKKYDKYAKYIKIYDDSPDEEE
jgi:hypothetical protein